MAKIFVVTNPMPLHNNSPAVSLGKFLQVISCAGYSPTVIGARLPSDGIPGAPDNVESISFRYGGRSIFKVLSYIALQIRLFFFCLSTFRRGDAVYFWIADKMIGAFFAARLRGAETNFFLYGRVVGGNLSKLADKLVLYLIKHADHVCAEAPSVFEQWDIPENVRRKVIKLHVDNIGIETVPLERREPVVAMMCRLCHGKHVDDAIRAFTEVHLKKTEYRLKIIGGGVLEEDCRRLVRDLGAEDYILVTGWLSREEAVKNIAECRLLLYPTDAEGVPGGILEAMSMGIPAIASPVGGIPDLIEDGVDGVLLSGTAPDTIAAELTALLDGGQLSEMSAAAERKIKEYFSLDAAAKNFRAVCGDRK